jgi:hypothetical protein
MKEEIKKWANKQDGTGKATSYVQQKQWQFVKNE